MKEMHAFERFERRNDFHSDGRQLPIQIAPKQCRTLFLYGADVGLGMKQQIRDILVSPIPIEEEIGILIES